MECTFNGIYGPLPLSHFQIRGCKCYEGCTDQCDPRSNSSLQCICSGNKLEIRRRGDKLLIYRKTIIYNYFAFNSENKQSCCLRLLICLLKCYPFSPAWAKGTGTALGQQRAVLFCKADTAEERTELTSRLWLDPCASACFKCATFHLLFNVFPTCLTHPRWTGNQSAMGLCCWRTVSDVLGKFPKSFLTLPPSPASSVSCQNITLAGDSKVTEVVSHLTQLIVVSGSSRKAQNPVMWRAVRTSPAHGKPYTVQRLGALGGTNIAVPPCPKYPLISCPPYRGECVKSFDTHTGTGTPLSGS